MSDIFFLGIDSNEQQRKEIGTSYHPHIEYIQMRGSIQQ